MHLYRYYRLNTAELLPLIWTHSKLALQLTLKQKFLSKKFGVQGLVLQSIRFSSFLGSGRLCSWIISSPRSLSTTQY